MTDTIHPKNILRDRLQLLEPTDLAEKLASVRRHMSETGLSSLLVSDNANKFYLTGRVFDGYIYLSPTGQTVYLVRRPANLAGEGVHHIRKPENMHEIMDREHIARPESLGLELDQSPYSQVRRLADALGISEFGNADTVLMQARSVKTAAEIEAIAFCGVKHERVYRRITHLYREGMSDIELQVEIERLTRLEGGMGQLRVTGHDMEINMGSVLAGANADEPSPYDFALGGAGASPALPVGADGTILKPGMTIMVDTNGDFNGYMTDMTRTFSLGDIPEEARCAHDLSRKICREMERLAVPGAACADLYEHALGMVREAGLTEFFMGHRSQAGFIGHGVGIAINELPVLSPRSRQTLVENNVIAIEPKFVIPHVGAVGIENTYAVTPTGLRCFTNAPEEIIGLDL